MRAHNWKLIPILTILLLFFVAPGAHAAPTITSLSVSSGPVGTAVTITGTNFGSTQGTSTVKFNGTTASVTSWSATSIGVTVPSAATTGNVVVTVSNVASNGKSFTVTPAITSLSITTGAVGAAVTITGTTFGSTQGTSTAKFNGTTATVTSWGASSIAVTVPSGATTGNVVVTVSSQPSNGVNFTVVPAPSITSVSITTGAVGAAVTITGSNFGSTQGTSTVKFHGTTASPTSWSATSIAVSVPSGATTGTVVVHASGVDSNGVNFTVVPAPNITSLSVITGAVGTAVTVTGSNFGSSQGTGTVTFNGTTANVTSWGASSIGVTVPAQYHKSVSDFRTRWNLGHDHGDELRCGAGYQHRNVQRYGGTTDELERYEHRGARSQWSDDGKRGCKRERSFEQRHQLHGHRDSEYHQFVADFGSRGIRSRNCWHRVRSNTRQ